MSSIVERIIKFNSDRDWAQYHSPQNLAKSIVIEAAELLEQFQWSDEPRDLSGLTDELADVLIYCHQLAIKLDLDVETIMHAKIDKNEAKYPVDLAKGNSKKYTEFDQ